MSTTEKLLINDEHKSGYLKDVWNSLFDPDIIRSIEEDNLTIKAIIMLLETAVISVKAVAKELKETENEKKSLQKCLQTIKTDNEILKQPCRQCPELQKKLTEQMKKTKDCKRSIQSIFTLLKPMTDNNGEDTQKAFLETQTIMGKYIAEDNDIIPETPGCSTKAPIGISSKSDHHKYQSEFEIISSGEEQYNCSNERVTPEKDNGKKTSAVMSPVLKSAKRTIQFKESQKKTSPDKSQKRSESQNRSQPGNNTKLEWKLRADEASSSRLKQATLSVKARPRPETKRDLSMMEGFSGGTLAGGGGTLAGAAASSKADKSDDCIATSPGVDANRLSGLSLSKKRPRTSKETVDTCGQMPTVMTLDETHFEPMAASTCKIDHEEMKLKKNHSGNQKKTEPPKPLPASTSRKEPTAAANPVFRYERGAVKKKSERLKLDGWSCDDCEKYYANMEKAGMNASQIKRTMNKCSRHRNQFQRAVTPPDFWNPKFDTSDEESY